MKKRGVMQLPFGMIWSIILIIIFVSTAFFAIKYFLGLKKSTDTGLFLEELQTNVDVVWREQSRGMNFERALPTGIKKVCFIDFEKPMNNEERVAEDLTRYRTYEANLFFWPIENAGNLFYKNLKHVNISLITAEKNPYCVENTGKVRLRLEKGVYDALVKIS